MKGNTVLPEKRQTQSPLREARHTAGLTCVQVAEQMGVSPASVTRMELGQTHPPVGALYRFAVVVGMSALAEELRPIVESLPNGARTGHAEAGRKSYERRSA